jgi:general secretion pathway protein N
VLGDGQSQWPAGLLAGLGTPWNTVQPQGQLVTSSQNVAMEWEKGRMRLSGQLQVDALRMSSRLSTLSPMGSYRITVQGGSEPTLQLATLEGSLQLSGQGQWIAQRLRFNGVASADPARVEALSNLLNIVGRRDGARSIITVG